MDGSADHMSCRRLDDRSGKQGRIGIVGIRYQIPIKATICGAAASSAAKSAMRKIQKAEATNTTPGSTESLQAHL
jgi:hypothetical protein